MTYFYYCYCNYVCAGILLAVCTQWVLLDLHCTSMFELTTAVCSVFTDSSSVCTDSSSVCPVISSVDSSSVCTNSSVDSSSVCTNSSSVCRGSSSRVTLKITSAAAIFLPLSICVQTAADEAKKTEEEISEKYKELQKEVKTLRTEVQRNTTLQDIVDILSSEKSELKSKLDGVTKEMQMVRHDEPDCSRLLLFDR